METEYAKPTFSESEIEIFERSIERYISKGYNQITLSTSFLQDNMQRFATYLGFHYPAGSFNPNPNYRNYKVAKKGKKYDKRENW